MAEVDPPRAIAYVSRASVAPVGVIDKRTRTRGGAADLFVRKCPRDHLRPLIRYGQWWNCVCGDGRSPAPIHHRERRDSNDV